MLICSNIKVFALFFFYSFSVGNFNFSSFSRSRVTVSRNPFDNGNRGNSGWIPGSALLSICSKSNQDFILFTILNRNLRNFIIWHEKGWGSKYYFLLQNKLENSINLMMMVYFSVYSFCSIKRSKCFENSFLNIRRKIPLRHDRERIQNPFKHLRWIFLRS